jgi:hypothetical protein
VGDVVNHMLTTKEMARDVKKKWWGCWMRYQRILKGIGEVIEDVKKMMKDD